jgi:hypothetical protein
MPKIYTRRAAVLLGIAALFLSACGGDTNEIPSTATQIPTARNLPTSAISQRATLPPTWTPTATPTITNTPTITVTFTPTATRTVQEICDGFSFNLDIDEERVYTPSDKISLLAMTDDPTTAIELTFTQTESGEEDINKLPGGNMLVGDLSLKFDAGVGVYEWRISVSTLDQSGLCEHTGRFTIAEEPRTPLQALGDLLATLASNAEPRVIVVTATPEGEATPEGTPDSTP